MSTILNFSFPFITYRHIIYFNRSFVLFPIYISGGDNMRRSERQVKDLLRIKEIMDACYSCNIAFNHEDGPYIVPLNFAYEELGGDFILYMHGAKEGRKADLMKNKPNIGFEMDTNGELKTNDTACGHSSYYSSVIGTGKICLLEDLVDKKHGLTLLMKKYTGKDNWDFPEQVLERTGVYMVNVKNLTCKEQVDNK